MFLWKHLQHKVKQLSNSFQLKRIIDNLQNIKIISFCFPCRCTVKCASLKRRSKNLNWRSTAAHSATVHIAAFTITSARRIDCYLTILVTAGLRRYAVAAEEVLVNLISVSPCNTFDKGTSCVSKADEFSEKFQTAFDPPAHFQKIILQFLLISCSKSPLLKIQNLQYKLLI